MRYPPPNPTTPIRWGDPRGIAIGYSAKDMVFIDPAYGPATNRPGAIGMIGEPGSGKSYNQ